MFIKLTDENINKLFERHDVVRVSHGNITLGLTRDCLKSALECLGNKAKDWNWYLLNELEEGEEYES